MSPCVNLTEFYFGQIGQSKRSYRDCRAAMGEFFREPSTRFTIFSSLSSFIVLDSSSFLSQVEKNELIELYQTLLGKLVFTREVLDPKFHKKCQVESRFLLENRVRFSRLNTRLVSTRFQSRKYTCRANSPKPAAGQWIKHLLVLIIVNLYVRRYNSQSLFRLKGRQIRLSYVFASSKSVEPLG